MSPSKTYDVFICHNSQDRQVVKAIADELKRAGYQPWFADWECRPGLRWQSTLEKYIKSINAAAVFVGKSGIGPWQEMEIRALLDLFVKRRKKKRPLIPVILPGRKHWPKDMPLFLDQLHGVDFRKEDPDPLEQLIWGITGERGLR